MHFPSFLVGSLVSGGAFLLVDQQMAYRERLTYKWPLAQWSEDQFRAKWKELMTQLKGERQQIRQQLNIKKEELEIPTFSRDGIVKKWNQMVDNAQGYFSKRQ
ncbi:hypothetical protein IV203_010571 [Nitzschia inconspicua]|uniref:Found in mitochondrial proteome protein 51 n=1 Tax=Nitzschia inconspicua TaxID=303405 RepID=A0A9K3KY14_9STRA|nr:hypothetical protein IV203_010571 [Nitzschia inconspicua]